MSRRFLTGFVLACLVACGSKEDTKQPASNDAGTDTGSVGNELTVEVWRGDFWNRLDNPVILDRQSNYAKAFAAGGSDVMCLNYVWRKPHRDKIVELAKATYPYSAHAVTSLDSKATDATDSKGVTPMDPTDAPCTKPDTLTKIDAGYACLTKNCSTIPGSMDGYFTDFKCYQANCIPEGLDLITSDPRCATCVQTYLEDSTYAEGKKQCTTNAKAGWFFSGENGSIILSKYPIKKSEQFVLPGSKLRQVVVRAEVDVKGKSVDVYCGSLQFTPDDLVNPYVGGYGDGKTGVDGWLAENFNQANKVAAFVKKSTGPAVLMLDTRVSRETKDGDKVVIFGSNKAGLPTLDLLEKSFAKGVAQSWKPECNDCPTHAGHPGSDPFLWEAIFLHNLPQSAVKSTAIGRKEELWKRPADGVMVPLDGVYSLKSTIGL
jgi:hypothetical protein